MSTVLIVEDEPDILSLERMYLELGGYTVLEAQTGVAALSVLDGDGTIPDAILLDLRLPDMDGLEVLELLKMTPRLKDIPVIVASAHTTPSTARRASELGAQGYLTKPFQFDDLLRRLEELLG